MKFELLIRNATVIDGTRAARFEADIGVSSGRISSIGKLKEKGEIEIDASGRIDRKSTRLNSSHLVISYAVFCLKKNRVIRREPDAGRPQLGRFVERGLYVPK